jgi:hypothetical protein
VDELIDTLDRFEPIGLEALDPRAALQQRVDHKYLVEPRVLVSLLERLLPGFVALEIGGRRLSLYESVYFDTPGLRCYRDHVEESLPRLKVRTRLYVETRVCSLEAKLKRGRQDGQGLVRPRSARDSARRRARRADTRPRDRRDQERGREERD